MRKFKDPEKTEGLIPYILRTKRIPSRKKMEVELIDFVKELRAAVKNEKPV
jgi:hypothetical protein